MQHFMDVLSKGLEAINSPAAKSALLFVGAWIWNRHRATVNKAIPGLMAIVQLTTGVGQFITTLIANAFPEAGVHPASVALAAGATAGGDVLGFLFRWVVPPLLVVGSHSLPKNLIEWMNDGMKYLKPNNQRV